MFRLLYKPINHPFTFCGNENQELIGLFILYNNKNHIVREDFTNYILDFMGTDPRGGWECVGLNISAPYFDFVVPLRQCP